MNRYDTEKNLGQFRRISVFFIKKLSPSSQKYTFEIRDQGSEIRKKPTYSGSQIRNTGFNQCSGSGSEINIYVSITLVLTFNAHSQKHLIEAIFYTFVRGN
jgi:hypothetical protein